MLFKDLLQVLVKIDCYSIRIDTYDADKKKTTEKNIYSMNDIPMTTM